MTYNEIGYLILGAAIMVLVVILREHVLISIAWKG